MKPITAAVSDLPTVTTLDYVNRVSHDTTAIAIVLALAALALLISLALESRPLPVGVHVAQYTISSDLERMNDDFKTLVASLQSLGTNRNLR